MLKFGEQVDPYIVQQPLVTGGCSEVYKATQNARFVALKILREDKHHHPLLPWRMTNESLVLSKIKHPGVVQVFQHGHHKDGRPYLALVRLGHFSDVARTRSAGADGERARSDRPSRTFWYGDRGNEDVSRQMPGGFGRSSPGSDQVVLELLPLSLAQSLPLPPHRAVSLAASIASTLAALHADGIVHRDLKPQNVMLTEDGQPKLVDFGVAKLPVAAATPEAPLLPLSTDPGSFFGTLEYAAPEQIADASLRGGFKSRTLLVPANG